MKTGKCTLEISGLKQGRISIIDKTGGEMAAPHQQLRVLVLKCQFHLHSNVLKSIFQYSPDDPSGLYWKLDMATLTTGTGTDCIPIGSDFSMPIPCAAYYGVQFGFTLRLFYPNPYDPSGLYWNMDLSTFEWR